MSSVFLRVYRSLTIEEVKRSLLIVGEVTGNCAQCGELGLDPVATAECPQCKARFRFIACRRIEAHPQERFQYAHRISTQRPDLTLIDLQDYQKMETRDKARNLLG